MCINMRFNLKININVIIIIITTIMYNHNRDTFMTITFTIISITIMMIMIMIIIVIIHMARQRPGLLRWTSAARYVISVAIVWYIISYYGNVLHIIGSRGSRRVPSPESLGRGREEQQ